MRTLFLSLSLCMLAGLVACKAGDKESQPPATETQQTSRSTPAAATPATPAELTVEGELRTIDVNAKTLVLKDASGADRTFSFTDSTGIIGAPGAQGLSGKQGSHTRIGYVTQGDTSVANWIEISPATTEPARK
jgi:hypothetical protein